MKKSELERLNQHVSTGSDMASAILDYADEELHAAIVAYRQAAEELAQVTADRLEVSASVVDWEQTDLGATDADPDAAALATRLSAETGVRVDADLIFVAREALDICDGDRDSAYDMLRSRQAR